MKSLYHLLEMIQLIEKYHDQPNTILIKGKEEVVDMYHLLAAGEVETEADLAAQISETTKQDNSYQKIKSQLKSCLTRGILQLDFSEDRVSPRKKAYLICYQEWAAANILLGKSARNAGIDICLKVLKKARKYEFSDLVTEICRVLRLHYATREGDESKFDLYNSMYHEYAAICEADNLAEELYTQLVLKFVKKKGGEENKAKQAAIYYQRLLPALQKYDSYRLHLSAYLIQLLMLTSQNDYPQVILICSEMISFFEQKSYRANVPLQIAYYHLLVAYTQIQDYDKAREAAENCLPLVEKGSINWHKYQELLLQLNMHQCKFEDAYYIYRKVVKEGKLKFSDTYTQEMWRIIEAFVYWLKEVGALKIDAEPQAAKKFRLGKFLNQTPGFSMDKRGMNIPILVVQILFLIVEKKHDDVIDKIEAINKYCSRYLNSGGTYRSNVFIKMLLQIPANRFHREAVIRKTMRYRKLLEAHPLKLARQTHEIEIIPYEYLWDIILDNLGGGF